MATSRQSEYNRQRYAADPERFKSLQRAKHGITETQYQAMLERQDGRCAICGKTPDEAKQKNALSIDHDHACCPGKFSCGACVRGLLCIHCNAALAWYERNVAAITTYRGASQ